MDGNFNGRETIRVGPRLACAQVGVAGFDGPIDLQALRLYGCRKPAPAVLNGAPLPSGSGCSEFAAEVSWDLPSLATGATATLSVQVGKRRIP